MANEITLTIDGVDVKTVPGNNVLQAAIDAGLYIPYLCYYPDMKAFGACRMCVVTVEQKTPDGEYRTLPGSPASCTTPVADGMRVTTNSDDLVSLRRGVMDLLISEHPHGCLTCHRVELCGPSDICLRHVSVNDRCVTCPKNERCELKDTVRYLEMDLETSLTYNNRHIPLKVDDPLWEMDMNLCIVCGRCVRVCDEIRGDNALTFTDRAGRSLIGTSQGTSLLESGCEFCGACIDVCPTGALVERDHKWSKASKVVKSICPHCPVGCQVSLEVDKRNRLIRTSPDISAPANRGQVCFKGKFGLDFVNRKERLRKPLIRSGGSLVEKSLIQAYEGVAEKLGQYQGEEFALITSPRGTNEDNYVAQKFTRAVMGSNNIDVSSNLMPELKTVLGDVTGVQAATNPVMELENSKGFLVVSSNITEEQNVAAIPIKKAVKNGASLIVIDPRETELTRYSNLWLRPRPGTEVALIGGILKVIVDESLDDHQFLASRAEGLREFKNSLWEFDIIAVSDMTEVSHQDIREAARIFAKSRPASVLYSLETVPPELRDACVRGVINLAMVTGNVGKSSSGLYPLYFGANEQGAKDVGCSPGYLPGYHSISDASYRSVLKKAWDAEVPSARGLEFKELPDAIQDGRVKALLLAGDSANYTNGELGDFLKVAGQLECLVVLSSFRSDLTDVANFVFPTVTFAENKGTYTNMERRLQLILPALGPKGDEESDWQIISRIAGAMGATGFEYGNAESVFEEIAGLVDIYGGVSHKRLESSTIQWPCLDDDSPGTPILHSPVADAPKIKLSPMMLPQIAGQVDSDYPFVLVKGRLLHQYHRTMSINKIGKRNTIDREEWLELHPDDAQNFGIVEGDSLEILSVQDRFMGKASLTGVHKGIISTTSLFGDVASHFDSSIEPDPVMYLEGLPLRRVRIKKLSEVEHAAD